MSLPQAYNLGKHWQTLTVVDVTVAETTGIYTVGGTPVSILGTVEELNEEGVYETVNLSPATRTARNPVRIEVGTRFQITELMTNPVVVAGAYRESVLRYMDLTYQYVRIAFKASAHASAVTMTLTGLIVASGSPRSKGRNTYSITIETIDLGAANPSFA